MLRRFAAPCFVTLLGVMACAAPGSEQGTSTETETEGEGESESEQPAGDENADTLDAGTTLDSAGDIDGGGGVSGGEGGSGGGGGGADFATDDDEGQESCGYVPTDTDDTTSADGPGDEGGLECGEACDIWNPNACAEGEKCTAIHCWGDQDEWDFNACREVQGGGVAGDPCTSTDSDSNSGNDDCDLGFMCLVDDTEALTGTCVAFCEGGPSDASCPPGYSCQQLYDGVLPLCLALP